MKCLDFTEITDKDILMKKHIFIMWEGYFFCTDWSLNANDFQNSMRLFRTEYWAAQTNSKEWWKERM